MQIRPLKTLTGYSKQDVFGRRPRLRKSDKPFERLLLANVANHQGRASFSRQMQALRMLDLNRVLQHICRILLRLIGEDIQLDFIPEPKLGKV